MADDKKKKKKEELEENEVVDEAAESEDADSSEDSASEDSEEKEEVFVENPTFNIEYKGNCAYEVKVTVPVANEQSQAEKMFDELKHGAEVPGFRKGRAPRKLIERKFAKAVRSEVQGKLVSAAFHKLIEDEKLRPIGLPDIDGIDEDKERKEGEPLDFTLKFEVAPRVELGKYRGIAIERPVLKVEDRDVNDAIENMRSRYAVFEPLKRKGKAKDGDQVIIDFKGLIDGEEFPGGTATDYPYILGTKRFFAEFEEVLNGSSPGDELTCEVAMPKDAPNEAIRGKKAQFTIQVKELKRRNLPALDDDFAKKANFENVADMREKIVARLRSVAEEDSNRVTEMRALNAVIEASTFEIPPSLIQRSSEQIYQDEVRRLLGMRVPLTSLREREEELREQAKETALNEIKRLTVLNEVGEAEGIEVTEDDFEQEIESIAQRIGLQTEMVSQYMEDQERRSSYEDRIYRAKALKAIMDNAVITEKEVSRETLDQENKSENE